MILELQTVVAGVLANVLGDQILIMLLSGALHLWGSRRGAHLASHVLGGSGMNPPEGAMDPPEDAALLPADAP